MPNIIRLLALAGGLSLLLLITAMAQEKPPVPDMTLKRVEFSPLTSSTEAESPKRYAIPGKRASQYTKEDWGKIIDSTWGPGQSVTDQLQVFDQFWDLVDKKWAAFPNLPLSWDSVRNVYRPQIGAGLSRGRFYALMSRLWMGLQELHTNISDSKVESILSDAGKFRYRRGVPLLMMGPGGSLIGAAVLPLPDSTNVVYNVVPGNPLGLEPGDLVLGYEGVPWKQLYRKLLDAGLPVSFNYSWFGSTPESQTYFFLLGVACNWGLFDTIDVVKYSSGDTVHLPTFLLESVSSNVYLNDQVKINGVPMPGAPYGTKAVSSGVVQGTNIGYIYAWDWASTSTSQLFSVAVDDLIRVKKVDGLVLDFRMNWGGGTANANAGFSQLFSSDPTLNFSFADRTSPNDHMGFTLIQPAAWQSGFLPASQAYDRPIAVLIGPGCFSSGDHNASRIRFHPRARLFGMPTNGAFVTGITASGSLSDSWNYSFHTRTVYSKIPNEGYLIHKGVQPDEVVWLTRDDAAKGDDTVVKRAIAWIRKTTSVQLGQQEPRSYELFQSYPNPFNPSTTISYELPKASHVSLCVYNTLGQLISVLVDENKPAGVFSAQFDAATLPSGVYFYRLQAGQFIQTKKLVLVK